jgi:zinc transporter ZupT
VRDGRLRVRHAPGVAAAALVGAALVALVFVRVDVGDGLALRPRFDLAVLRERLPVHAGWLPPFAALAGLLPALRALVWRAVLPAPPPPLADAYHATAIGALVHNTVPGKLGPLAASFTLARAARRPFTPLLASQLVAKLLEMGAVVALGAAGALSSRPAGDLGRAVTAGAALFLTFSAIAVGLALLAPGASARLGRRFPRAGGILADIGEGVSGAGGACRLAAAVALAFLPALAASSAYALPLRAAGVSQGLGGGAMLVAVLTFGQLTPGLPIGTGVYWSLAAWAAREMGAPPADAAAIAVLSHAAMVGTNLLVGGGSALARRGTLSDLVRRRREVERLASRAPRSAPPRAPT